MPKHPPRSAGRWPAGPEGAYQLKKVGRRSLLWSGVLLLVAAAIWVAHVVTLMAIHPTLAQLAWTLVIVVVLLFVIWVRARRH